MLPPLEHFPSLIPICTVLWARQLIYTLNTETTVFFHSLSFLLFIINSVFCIFTCAVICYVAFSLFLLSYHLSSQLYFRHIGASFFPPHPVLFYSNCALSYYGSQSCCKKKRHIKKIVVLNVFYFLDDG